MKFVSLELIVILMIKLNALNVLLGHTIQAMNPQLAKIVPLELIIQIRGQQYDLTVIIVLLELITRIRVRKYDLTVFNVFLENIIRIRDQIVSELV